jgi:uncharacterized protein (DUF885 family)
VRRILLAAALLGVAACQTPAVRGPVGTPRPVAPDDAEMEYGAVAREFLAWYLAANPTRATALGIHAHDHALPDLTAAAIARRGAALRGWLARLQAIPVEPLDPDSRFDHRILDHAIRAELLDLEEVRPWRSSPGAYVGPVAGGVSALAVREFAPLEVRVRALVSRLEAVPALLAAGRRNLTEVPESWIAPGVANARGTASFLRASLPGLLEGQGMAALDPELRRAMEDAALRAAAEMEAFADWMAGDLLPRASGDFRLGRELYERKLLYEEHFALSADSLREINRRAIDEYRARVEQVAAAVDPGRTAERIMDSIARLYPAPDRLVSTAARMVQETRAFVVERDIVTLPSDGLPTVRESPEYARGGFASMSTPGPFETVATEAFYNVTNVDPAWTEEQRHQHLTYFNHAGLLGITVHEAFPGHFVQLLYRQFVPTDVRKVFAPATLVEGWAHYTEQMMVDEGLGGGDPGIRLGQLRRALQRHARWDAAVGMHAFGEEIPEVVERFAEIAYFAPFPALREVQRGTSDPMYLSYALGRMEILRLREDYRRMKEARGERFSLRDFHDAFLRLGLPIPLAREAMLGTP